MNCLLRLVKTPTIPLLALREWNAVMKALFLGHFAATVAPRLLAKVKTPFETSVLDDEGDAARLAPLLAEVEIVVGHISRRAFAPAPCLRLLQSVAAALDLL